jgi:hypothetical protein
MRVTLIAALTWVLGACATGLTPREPTPHLDAAALAATPTLEIAPGVRSVFYAETPDNLDLSGEDAPSIRVVQWRAALVKGFHNAFPAASVDAAAAPCFQIRIADLSLREVDRNAYGRVVSVKAAVRYQIHLAASDGAVLRRAEGTAVSRRSTGSLSDLPDLAADAIEVMYESAARELLADLFNGAH